ncbi:bark agglutinin I polypeptide A-like [Cryptomeria japonica]|uniref:bark agglutinin I polypeptide A-like n=1 Tax=Cryptomeria japonica TaxID=3369 RepID=UPI0027DA7D45|nr:bark agglutinin I polypeptide A-like [Cryptomeria japonica]
MASTHQVQAARLFFCLSITCSAFCYMSDAGAISFSFPPKTNIQLSADASIYQNVIHLTKSRSGLGWATYSNIIPSKALASFSTHFQFSIVAVNGSGDGLTFFLAPSDFESFDADRGEWLGLFESETDGNSSNQIVAVEFDTYENEFDPDDNHVGIDVNSVISVKTVSVSDLYTGATLNNGEKWEVWVDYNGTQI